MNMEYYVFSEFLLSITVFTKVLKKQKVFNCILISMSYTVGSFLFHIGPTVQGS